MRHGRAFLQGEGAGLYRCPAKSEQVTETLQEHPIAELVETMDLVLQNQGQAKSAENSTCMMRS